MPLNETDSGEETTKSLKTTSYGTILFEWDALNDYTTERTANWLAAMLFFQVVFLLFSLITQQWFLLLILIVVIIVTVLLGKAPGRHVTNQITSLGIVIDGKLKKWSSLRSFWVLEDAYHIIVGFQSLGRFDLPEVVFIDDAERGEILSIIATYLPQEEKQVALFDVLINTLGFRLRQIYTYLSSLASLTSKDK